MQNPEAASESTWNGGQRHFNADSCAAAHPEVTKSRAATLPQEQFHLFQTEICTISICKGGRIPCRILPIGLCGSY
jgi:hypothetical protein